MSLANLLVRDVTIYHPASTSGRYGDTEKDWANATPIPTKGWVSQRTATEVLGDREAQLDAWILFLAADETISSGDRVVCSGTTFEVTGPPNHAWTPRGEHHLEVLMQAVTG